MNRKKKSLGYQMKRLLKCVWMGMACLVMAGCAEEEKWGTGSSGIMLSLENLDVEVLTKALPSDLDKPGNADLQYSIKDAETGIYKYEKEDFTTGLIPLSSGTYDIVVESKYNPNLDWDTPYYIAEETDVKVTETPTTVNMTAKVGNALFSVNFPEGIEEQLKGIYYYAFKIQVGNQSVEVTPTEKQNPYAKAGSTASFSFVYQKKQGDQKKEQAPVENKTLTVEAGVHYTINLSVNISDDLSMDITKVEETPVTIEETIPLEWLPAPKVSATGFDEATKTLDFYETNTPDAASIDFEVNEATGLQDLEFSLNFEDETFQELTGDYTLSTMSDEDKAKFADAGITLPLTGQTSPKIDFTSTFINQLRAKDEGAVVNTITIKKVTANNRPNKDESPLVYTINTHKPEFTVEVLDGNVWSKTFTAEEITVAEGKGNLETIKQNLVYQYSTDGNSWTDFSDQTTRTQAFAEHPDIKEYQVRAVYRGDLFSNNMDDLELEMPTQLPNSGMEEWSISSDNVGFLGFTYYTFYPYSSGESDVWWTTKNQRSQDGVKAGAISYKGSFSPCVSYSESEKHQGNRSALIYTSGHGGGYSSTSSVLYTKGAFAGSLFIGNYHWTGDSEEITQGHVFSVRPTALEFWYNYIPKKSDSFKAYIELRNGDEVIASGEFIPIASSSSSGWTKGTISLDDYIVPTKVATSIYVQFLSTTKTSFSESDFDKNKLITFPVMGDWNAHIGSMLYIDDLNLIYGR